MFVLDGTSCRKIISELYAYFDGVSEWDHDGDWKSFWNGDDEDRDADDDETHEVLDVGVIPRQLMDDEFVHREMHEQRDQVQHGDDDSYTQYRVKILKQVIETEVK